MTVLFANVLFATAVIAWGLALPVIAAGRQHHSKENRP